MIRAHQDFYSDSTKFRQTVGWHPQTTLREGLQRTIAFYRQHLPHYLDEPAPDKVLA